MADNRRIADHLRSTDALAEYFRICHETGDLRLVESALRDVPKWATFHDVREALRLAELRLTIAPLAADQGRSEPIERRKGPRAATERDTGLLTCSRGGLRPVRGGLRRGPKSESPPDGGLLWVPACARMTQ